MLHSEQSQCCGESGCQTRTLSRKFRLVAKEKRQRKKAKIPKHKFTVCPLYTGDSFTYDMNVALPEAENVAECEKNSISRMCKV